MSAGSCPDTVSRRFAGEAVMWSCSERNPITQQLCLCRTVRNSAWAPCNPLSGNAEYQEVNLNESAQHLEFQLCVDHSCKRRAHEHMNTRTHETKTERTNTCAIRVLICTCALATASLLACLAAPGVALAAEEGCGLWH